MVSVPIGSYVALKKTPTPTDSFVRVHRLDQVVDQRVELAGLDVLDLDVRCFLAQDRMSEAGDFEDRHQFLPSEVAMISEMNVNTAAHQNAPRTPARS